QPALRACRGTENRYVRIRRHYQKALTASHHKQGKKEESISSRRRRRKKEYGTHSAKKQACENSFLVTDSFHRPPGGKGGQEISPEQCHQDKRSLKIAETENVLQVRNHNVIDIYDECRNKQHAGDEHTRQ